MSLCLVARENQLLQRAFNVSMRDLFLGDILSHCVRITATIRSKLYNCSFYNMTPELAGSGAVGVPVGEAGEAGVCAIAAL